MRFPVWFVPTTLALAWGVPVQAVQATPLAPAFQVAANPAATNGVLDRRAGLDVEKVALPAALRALRDRSGISIVFSPSVLAGSGSVTCRCSDATVREALERLLRDSGFRFTWEHGQILIEADAPASPRTPELAMPTMPVLLPVTHGREVQALAVTRRQTPQTGTIAGLVTDRRTLAPLSGVQVVISQLSVGTLTGSDGRFLLTPVPEGTHVVEATYLGRATQRREVQVMAGQTSDVDFQLEEQVLALDELIVTGTAGQARRREVGNTISQINLNQVAEPVQSVDNLLQARVAGLSVSRGSGAAGSGGQIRLRGNVSVAMSNQPLVYVDGVRIRSDGYPRNVSPAGHQGRSNNDVASPLNDINTADIERIEVIKGAAATTLYGTEAAAGVIQIFTKRGATGDAVWTAQVDQGLAKTLAFAPEEAPYLHLDPWLRTAHTQGYSLSVSGGRDALRYFVSGGYDHNEGVLPNDWEEKYLFRGNFGLSPTSTLNLQWNTSFTNNTLSNTPAGNNSHGLMLNAFRGESNFFGDASPEVISQVLDYEIFNYIKRFITGTTATYTPTERLSNRLTVGYDLALSEMRQLRPFGFVFAPEGILSNIRWSNTTLTADYVGSYELPLTGALSSRLSWGGQWVSTEETSVAGYAEDFPGPGIPTLSSGANTLAFEDRIEVVNAGFFAQSLFSLQNRYFLTVGLRVDGNSAFGENFGLQYYPKVSGSYVISDEEFWREGWGQLRLRAAYGQSGRAPGAFDAVRTWNPQGWGGQPAFGPGNVGNPELGPERTAETELGFEAIVLDGRLTLDFTRYHQRTSDALFSVRQIPSNGFGSSQLENVGALENRGIEIAATGSVIDRPAWGVDLGLNVSTNRSKVLSLGSAPAFSLGSNGWIVEGQPVPVMRGWKVTNPDARAEPVIEEDHFYGPNQPTLMVGPRASIRFPGGLQLSGRGEYQGGHYMYEGGSFNALVRGIAWPTCSNAKRLLDGGLDDQLTAIERARCITANVRQDWFIYPVDFFRLRDVTLMVPLSRWVPRSHGASLTLSARDIWTWRNQDFPIMDPEVASNEGMNAMVRQIGEHVPPPAVFTASLRVSF